MSKDKRLGRSTRPRVDWPRALRAIRLMQRDPSRTDQVFELNVALDGGDTERLYRVFLAEPDGPALLRERPVLLDPLSDFARLRRLPATTLGGAYVRLMERAGYPADGLRQASEKIAAFAELHPGAERTWLAQRGNCVHDLLHVLTGYGQDPAGETSLLAFTDGLYSQHFRFRVIRFGLFASVVSAPWRSIPSALAFAIAARRRGAQARIPHSYRWEDALERSLSTVRSELRVAPISDVHPDGILHGSTEAPWHYGPAVC